MQPLGDAIDEQVHQVMLAELATREALVVRPQAFRNLAHRALRQQALAVDIGERRLDVAHRQPARVHLNGQPLELFGAATQRFANRRAKRLYRATHLRHRVVDAPLGAAELAAPIAIAMSARGVTVLVITATQHVLDFLFESFFHDQLRRQLHQLAAIALCRPASLK